MAVSFFIKLIINKENSFLEDGALEPLEESDTAVDYNETKPPEQNSVPVETTAVDQKNESAVATDLEENTKAEETEENFEDSSEE